MSNSSIQPIDRILSGATIPSRSLPGSNGKEGVFHIPQSLKTFRLLNVITTTFSGKALPFCRDAVCVIYSPNRLG